MSNTETPFKAYKVFNPDMTCQGFQFKLGEEFKHDGKIKLCNSGFHFCIQAAHCFNYYSFDSKNIVCEVEIRGEIDLPSDSDKGCTNLIFIARQLDWQEVLSVANFGKDNTGHSNTGNRNTGYSNTGNSNTGNRNTGNWNTGYSNTGDSNTGDSNTGDSNTGDSNTGDSNTGNSNTGNWNTGNWNTGYSNTGDRNTGVFCTGEKYMTFFDKPSKMTEEQFFQSTAYNLLCQIDTKQWVPSYAMTEAEKEQYPSHKTCEGYLKDIPFKEAFQNAWHNWSEDNRSAFTSLPNFDKKIFKKITGVTVK